MNEVRLSENSYGKSDVEVFLCLGDDLWLQIIASIKIEGSFEAVYVDGHNSQILPTDTFSNHFEDLASSSQGADLYEIGVGVLDRLMECMEDAKVGSVQLSATRWRRLLGDSNSMVAESPSVEVSMTRGLDGRIEIAGYVERRIIRSSGSSFAGFRRDGLTDKEDVESRILYGDLRASWRYCGRPTDLFESNIEVAERLFAAFGSASSNSLQENIYKAGAMVLSARSDIDEIAISFDSFGTQKIFLKSSDRSNNSRLWRSVSRPVGTSYAKVVRDE